MKLSYSSAGVDIARALRIKKKIKKLASAAGGARFSKLDGFGGFFNLDQGFKHPLLVSSTDGVGTKLKIAFLANKHDTVGEDLVNHCVNDILVHGARPLFFLDYIACGPGALKFVPDIVTGMTKACQKVNCALIGGETAQLPEMYQKNEYDLAGFIVGGVEKKDVIDGKSIKPGDILLGLASSGLHTNGYTLARKILLEKGRLGLNKRIPELGCMLGEELLKVHGSYAGTILPLLPEFDIKGMAHITGGGIRGNLIRILPQGCQAQVETQSWQIPPIFRLIQKLGGLDSGEMFLTFNMGIGMILAVRPQDARELTIKLSRAGETVHSIGKIVRGQRGVKLLHL